MLNIMWPAFIIISYIYAICAGKTNEINNSIFESCKNAVELSITFLGTMCLWTGIMQIVKKTTLIEKLVKGLKPVMKILFPKMKQEEEAYQEISMNMIANILGLGNAATPLGIKAMKTMQQTNSQKDKLTNSMAMFIIINTASIQIIPTTVIAIRSSLGSNNPTSIILPVWIATISAAIAGILCAKLFIKTRKDK